MFHFGQACERLKKKIDYGNCELFDIIIRRIKECKTMGILKAEFHLLGRNIQSLNRWCDWWTQDSVLQLLFSAIQQNELNTFNSIESIHSSLILVIPLFKITIIQ